MPTSKTPPNTPTEEGKGNLPRANLGIPMPEGAAVPPDHGPLIYTVEKGAGGDWVEVVVVILVALALITLVGYGIYHALNSAS